MQLSPTKENQMESRKEKAMATFGCTYVEINGS